MSLLQFRETRSVAKRAAILAAARALFLDIGYDRVTVEQIARKSEVSTATIYNHYNAKAGLFEAVVKDAMRGFVLPPGHGLDLAARAYASLVAGREVRGLIRLVATESGRFPEVGQSLFDHGKAVVYQTLGAALQRESADGRIAPRPDWAPLVSQITGMINQSVLLPWLLAGREGTLTPDQAADAAVALVRRAEAAH